MPSMTEAARERAIDAELAAEQAARDEQIRVAKRAEHIERERVAKEAEEYAKQHAARSAFLERAHAAYPEACAAYKKSVDAFREARLKLMALDVILSHSGGFSDHDMAVALRHARAAPDERSLHHDHGATVAAVRKSLGG